MASKFAFKIFNGDNPQAQYEAVEHKDSMTFYLLNNGVGYFGERKLFDISKEVNVVKNINESNENDNQSTATVAAIINYVKGLLSEALADVVSFTENDEEAIPVNISGHTCQKIYATEEQVIGTWLDSKPIYRKVFPLSFALSSAVNTDIIDISSLNIDTCVNIYGKYEPTSASINKCRNFPDMFTTFGLNENKTSIIGYLGQGSNPITITFLILEYTKTIDTAITTE